MIKRIALIIPVVMLALAGCSKHNGSEKTGSQVVAKVNGDEITVHQLNFALSKMGKLDQSQLKPASEKVLQKMVDTELLKQKAIAAKMDRDPQVLQMLEAAKQQVLAQAYMQKIASRQTSPSSEDVKDFYDNHPELFSERNVYAIQEFVVQDGNKHAGEIEAGINAAKTADDISQWLKENDYVFKTTVSKKAAEQLPLDLLKKLNTLKAGDTVMVRGPDALVLLFLARVDKEPVSMEKAQAAIQRYLVNAGQQALIRNEVSALRKEAKVEFLGDFSNMTLDSEMASSETSPAEVKPDTPVSRAASVSPAAEPAPPVHNPAIEKGLSGL